MKQHIPVYNVGDALPVDGLINVCNIEEVWLNDYSNSVAIRYRSPNGKLIDHEEYYDCLDVAKRRFYRIKLALECDISPCQFKTSMKNQKEKMDEMKVE